MYLVSMQYTTDQPGVAPSHAFYFLLNKNASTQDATDALVAAIALVPEPGGAVAVMMLAPALMRRLPPRSAELSLK
jgi:hypothetical protein